ncbi:MAG: reverse transcriptase domain-containing protein [Methylococcus sp.]
MKALKHLWPSITAWDNLLLAYRKARRGKVGQASVQRFGLDLEWELAEIRQELLTHAYRPGHFQQFQIRDRKTRLISAAPFRDRVVHHALMGIVEPLIDRRFIDDTYASRKGKGVHAAVRRYQTWAQRYPYALKLDVLRYFDSIDHGLLKAKLARHIADPDVLWLFNRIIDHSPQPLAPHLIPQPGEDLVDLMQRPSGLPLGNLTSQFLGNFYLSDLDRHIKEVLRVPAYLRYVDDLVLLADDKDQLWAWCKAIETFLAQEGLAVHPRKKALYRTGLGQDILGYRVFPGFIRLSRGSGYRFRRRLKTLAAGYGRGQLELPDINARIAGWLGHARQADAQGLSKALLAGIYCHRGEPARRAPGGSRRFVEQQPSEPALGQPQQEPAG